MTQNVIIPTSEVSPSPEMPFIYVDAFYIFIQMSFEKMYTYYRAFDCKKSQ